MLISVADAGADVEAVVDDADDWVGSMFVAGGVLFALGWLSVALGLYQSNVLARNQTAVAIAAIIALVITLFIPVTGASYIVGIAAIVVSWLLGSHAWSRAGASAAGVG